MARVFFAAAAMCTAVLLGVPNQATAAVTEFYVHQGNSNGFGASCTYTVTAVTTTDVPVLFADLAGANFTPSPVVTPIGGRATANWTPNAPGAHLLSASQNDGVQTMVLPVGMGVSTGSTSCRVF